MDYSARDIKYANCSLYVGIPRTPAATDFAPETGRPMKRQKVTKAGAAGGGPGVRINGIIVLVSRLTG